MHEEEEKTKLQNDIRILTERLGKVNESLSRKIASRAEFDRTIAETEAAYTKVILATVSYVVNRDVKRALINRCSNLKPMIDLASR